MAAIDSIRGSAAALGAALVALVLLLPRAMTGSTVAVLVVSAAGLAAGMTRGRRGLLDLVTGIDGDQPPVRRRFAGLGICITSLLLALAAYLGAPAGLPVLGLGAFVLGVVAPALVADAMEERGVRAAVRGAVAGCLVAGVVPSITASVTVFVATRVWDPHLPSTASGARFAVVLGALVMLVGGSAAAAEREGDTEEDDPFGGDPTTRRSPVPTGSRGRDAALLDVEGLDLRYGKVQVLFGTTLQVNAGEALALLGTNGAGKSSVLRAVFGLAAPSAGTVRFAGTDITGRPAESLVHLGLIQVPGGRGIFPSLTVRENLRMAGYLHKEERRADEGIERTFATFPRLRERLDQPAGLLSGGEQQMLALGRAWITRPRLLAIDELTLGLAPVVVEELKDVVRSLRDDGVSMIIVEQSVHVALELTERACFLERGRVRFDGSTADLAGRNDLLRSIFFAGAMAGGDE